MNTSKNKVQLVGNIGMPPEIKDFQNGRKVARFTIATHEWYRNAAGENVQNTYWFIIVAWNKMADYARGLHKGLEIAVDGKLVSRNYIDKKGEKRTITEVVASELLILENKAKERDTE